MHEEGRDLVLPNNTYAHVLDETKGNIICYVGPSKTQLADTDKLVIFDSDTKKYRPTTQKEAVRQILVAPEGWYTVLKNPAKDSGQPNPSSNDTISIDKLHVGRKVHIPGPVSFPLWPGQMAQVIQGHRLRSNQYLIVRVYDAEAAEANWGSTIIQKTSELPIESTAKKKKEQEDGEGSNEGNNEVNDDQTLLNDFPAQETNILDDDIDFTIGKLMIVKGTDVSFFIPPTGIEVVKDANENYIREAVTLERLIYCVLLDESGSKRYIRGPAVVFPRPTEVFQTHVIDGKRTRRFRAIELNELSGIYIKVIAPYTENDREFHEGQELFITGKDQPIYYRRDEHQLIKYGNKEVHYATAVPKGEALYILHRLTGEIKTVNGPAMCLPDPRTEVIVRRILPLDLAELMYPDNEDVIRYNSRLKEMLGDATDFVSDSDYVATISPELSRSFRNTAQDDTMYASVADTLLAKHNTDILRETTYTKPRTVTLDTKYNGAVNIKIWTGYAVIIVNGMGDRKVIEGPTTYNLEYDEYPEVITMSTGKPKTTDHLLRDIYLRTKNNKISDIVTVETKDLVEVSIKLSYRVNFVGDKSKWFDVENYVKFLCDHMRSRLKGYAQTISLHEFYADSVDLVRDVILGSKSEDSDRGFLFEENNMFVSDVEVLRVLIKDATIAETIMSTQNAIVTNTINIARKNELFVLEKQNAEIGVAQRNLSLVEREHRAEIQIKKERAAFLEEKEVLTIDMDLETQKNKLAALKRQHSFREYIDCLNNDIELQDMRDGAKLARQKYLDAIAEAELERTKALDLVVLAKKGEDLKLRKSLIEAESSSIVAQMTAIQPKLVESLQATAQMTAIKDIMPHAIPLSIVEGKSVGHTLTNLFDGTAIGNVINNVAEVTSSDDQ